MVLSIRISRHQVVLINLHRSLHEKNRTLIEIKIIQLEPYLCHLLTRYQSTDFISEITFEKEEPERSCLIFLSWIIWKFYSKDGGM